MKKFKKISDEFYAVPEAGYKLDKDDKMHLEFPVGFSENRRYDEIDSFCDMDCITLCSDENGEMYAVMYIWWGDELLPMIWQKVIKKEGEKF